MANTRIQQVTNTERTPAYDVTKEIEVTPKEESKSTYLSMPTDPALLQEIQRQREAAARAYGVNPQTGAITPFEALGYNPEDERKRREAERALNDRKRKENAWYNAFAVLGDSLTAALGGNVWQRQPNNIGAKANADNARLIAEQKAEDEGNAAKLRAAGTAYANTVNKLLQNYLTKTTNTTTTGGSRKETTHHPEVSKTRQVAFPLGDADGSGSGSGNNNKEEFRFGSYRYIVPKTRLNNTIDRLYEFIRRNGIITDDDLIKIQGNTDSKKLDANSKRQLVFNKIYEIENNPELFKIYGGDIARELNWGALENENIIRVSQPKQKSSGRLSKSQAGDRDAIR